MSLLKVLLVVLLFAHGVAHLVGFAVPWRFIQDPQVTFGTSLFGGRLDVGEAGMRAFGVGWLLLAVACAVAAGSVAVSAGWAPTATAVVLGVSTAFCLLFLPDAKWGLLVNVGLIALLALWTVKLSASRWEAESARLRSAIVERAARAAAPASGESWPEAADHLPAPVERYLRHVLPRDAARMRTTHLEQNAQFLMGTGEDGWKPLTATQQFSTRPAGFVWDARIRVAPLVDAFVRDAYVDGRASMVGSALGIVALVDLDDSPELAAGALMRWLAEAVWFPAAYAPGNGVGWAPIDDHRARATYEDGDTRVSLEFRFNERDEVAEMFAPDRFREVDGRFEPTPWRVTCRDYRAFDGVRIPTWCEVAWELPEGTQVYWKGSVAGVAYGHE